MAIFSVNLRPFSRAKGESAVAAAAYRAGVALTDARTGIRHDFTRRKGVEAVDMVMPADAPPWAFDPRAFWNRVEAAETRINSRVARELLVALPHELSEPSRMALARDIAQHLVDRYQVGVQVALHAPDRKGDDRNHHVHLLLTTRTVGPTGLGGKVRCLDDRQQGPAEVEAIREAVATLTNAHLAASHVGERVDHRTLAVQAKEAEIAGDLDRAACLTREPTERVRRADIEEARRGRLSGAMRDNQDRRACHATDLAAYQSAVGSEGRQRLRAAVQKRWESRRDRAMASQRLLPAGAGRKSYLGKRRRLEDELLDTLRAGSEMASAVIQASGQRERLADRLAQLQSPLAKALRERAEEAKAALGVAQAAVAQRKARLRQVAQEREAMQRAWDKDLGARPGRFRPVKRQAWEQERRRLWGRLRKAIAAEQEAEGDLSPLARTALRNRVAEARQALAKAEADLRQQAERLVPKTKRPPAPDATQRPGPWRG